MIELAKLQFINSEVREKHGFKKSNLSRIFPNSIFLCQNKTSQHPPSEIGDCMNANSRFHLNLNELGLADLASKLGLRFLSIIG